MMQNVSVKLDDDLADAIDEHADDDQTRSDAIRELLERGLDYEAIEAERDDLQRQLAAANQRIDNVNDIVEYVDEEREVQRARRDVEQRRAEAGVLTRAKWWFTGMDVGEDLE